MPSSLVFFTQNTPPSHPGIITLLLYSPAAPFYILHLLLISPPAPPSRSSSSSCNSQTSSYKFSSPSISSSSWSLRLVPPSSSCPPHLSSLFRRPPADGSHETGGCNQPEEHTAVRTQLSGHSCQNTASCHDPYGRNQLSGLSCQDPAVRT